MRQQAVTRHRRSGEGRVSAGGGSNSRRQEQGSQVGVVCAALNCDLFWFRLSYLTHLNLPPPTSLLPHPLLCLPCLLSPLPSTVSATGQAVGGVVPRPPLPTPLFMDQLDLGSVQQPFPKENFVHSSAQTAWLSLCRRCQSSRG